MRKIIIADASCLILLAKINQLDILQKIYSEVSITPEIAIEFNQKLPEWIKIEITKDKSLQVIFEKLLDKGESSAIILAIENKGSTLIIDEKKGRKIAIENNIKITGTIGLLIKAKELGIIDKIKPIFTKIKETNFRISNEIEKIALLICKE